MVAFSLELSVVDVAGIFVGCEPNEKLFCEPNENVDDPNEFDDDEAVGAVGAGCAFAFVDPRLPKLNFD